MKLFYSDPGMFKTVKEALEETYGIEIVDGGVLKPPKSSYDVFRGQYDASILLSHLIGLEKEQSLWVIDGDLYVTGMNFVFGYASPGKGAVLSVARLHSDELIRKEAIHEVGHVLGLDHCMNECVMKFSNSIYEAEEKPSTLCRRCRTLLKNQTRGSGRSHPDPR